MAVCCSTSAFPPPLSAALAAVAQLGFAAVDLIAIEGWGHVEPDDLVNDWQATASQVEALLREQQLAPLAMNVAIGPLYRRDAQTSARRLGKVEAVVRLMQRLGVGVASFYPGYKVQDRPWDTVLADTVATVREILAIGRAAGVTLAIEPHFDTPFQTMAQIRPLLDAVPELGVAYDPSHFAMQGIDLAETACLLERAVHVHLRDAAPGAMQAGFGTGTVDLDWLLGALEERGYRGHLSIEYLRTSEFDVADSIRRTAEAVTRRMS